MGCASSAMVYTKDGSILPGKGDTKIGWDPKKPVNIGFYFHSEANAEIQLKEFPMDKEAPNKKFAAEGTAKGSASGMHWVQVVPGTRYAMRYLAEGHPVAFPNQTALQLPKKLHEFHTKDEEAKKKLVGDLRKDVEKDAEHVYTKDGGEAAATADVDAMAGFTTCAQFSENMGNFKKACQTIEDLAPWNTIDPQVNVWPEFGYWDEKDGKVERVLGLKEKALVEGEKIAKTKGAMIPHKALSTAQKVFKQVVEKAIEGATKKAGSEPAVLIPDLSSRIDAADNCAPGVDRLESVPEPEKKEEKKDEPDMEAEAKAQWEKDKSQIDAIKANDGKDRKSDAEAFLKAAFQAASSAADPSSVGANDIVNIKHSNFTGQGYVLSVDGEQVNVQWCKGLLQDSANSKIDKQTPTSEISGGKATDGKGQAFFKLPTAEHGAFLERGRWVRVREGDSFIDGWVTAVDGDNVSVTDLLQQPHTVTKDKVWICPTPDSVATRGVALLPQFAPLEFGWIAGEPAEGEAKKEIALRIWRFGAKDETFQTIPLVSRKQKANPTDEEKEPTREVHVGYFGTVDVMAGRKYCYNFKVGDDTMLGWEQKAASENGFKVITANTRVQY